MSFLFMVRAGFVVFIGEIQRRMMDWMNEIFFSLNKKNGDHRHSHPGRTKEWQFVGESVRIHAHDGILDTESFLKFT